MSDVVATARQQLLEAGEIAASDLDGLLGRLMSHRIDTGELFFQTQRTESWTLEDGRVRDGGFSVDRGVGVRAMSGEKTGFAYADDILLPALTHATDAARSIARQGKSQSVQTPFSSGRAVDVAARYGQDDPIASASEVEKVALLQRLDAYARSLDSRIKEVTITLAANFETNLVVSTDGTVGGDVRPLVRLNVSVIAEQKSRRERGSAGGGGRHDLAWVTTTDTGEAYVREAVRIALLNLDAVNAPAGSMPVVLGPGWPGVLLHEAVGHGLEGDANRKGTSVYANRIGEQVASVLCTVIDDATIDDRRGSLNVDDEGTPGERTVLIEKGILKGYMQDKLNARLMNTRSTGNGRRQSYAYVPMPRMTNTFMLGGEHEPDEIISTVGRGVYAANFGGGSVDTVSGKFVFSATEAYLIENGKVTRPIRGATLIGNGPEVMTRISMLGNDMALDSGVGNCGKDGQTVPVGVGQPTVKIDELTVGGTRA